ncbi:hypothetical protein SAMN05518800_2879 [Variovorax sp. YR752]|nr:hypothetical protein [Variovorax sp. YR752]SOD27322.1 hypothetical protein SAMN05518800_2879 [Variovorax sp. YR752]
MTITSPLNRMKAKERMLRIFALANDPATAAKPLSDDELEAMLDAIRELIPLRKPAQHEALERFLYAGACRFDRWFPPTPFVIPPSNAEKFSKFAAALSRAERDHPLNSPVFQLHAIKDEIFHRLDGIAHSDIPEQVLRQFREKLERVASPESSTKQAEFSQQKDEISMLLRGIGDGSLQTILTFDIPYLLHKQKLNLSFVWREIPMQIFITPRFRPLEETFFGAAEGAALSVGASRWQTGTSHVTIQMAALLDGSAYTESLQAFVDQDPTIEGWPKSFTWAFLIFSDMTWRLKADHGGHQDWIPAPRDLSALEYSIKTSERESLAFIAKGSPAALIEIFEPSDEVLAIELKALDSLPWPQECRTRASMYLELGDTNEALFWLNVSVESLVAGRFKEIEQATGETGLAEALGSPKEFWDQAEQILSKQFPDMADKVKWPSAPIHVSVFGKLKVLYRRVAMRTSLEELLRKYRDVSGERNDLFHGTRTGRVSVAAVRKAFDALAWIDENMWPQAPGAVAPSPS